jgi:hypothetical protein
MTSYKHSGTFGDLIYSLSVVKKMAVENNAQILIALNNIENCVAQYGYRPDEVDPMHKGRFTFTDYELLKPFLQRQSYIQDVGTWTQGTPDADVDLDRFRGVLFRGFEGNYVQAYHMTFGLPFRAEDLQEPWLEADPIQVAPIVINRTFRYRCPDGTGTWQNMLAEADIVRNGVFVGNKDEHEDFVRLTGFQVPYYYTKDFKHLADVIAGSDLFMGSQSAAYAIAMGLGKSTVLETIKIKPLQNNECYFPRSNCQYF